MQGDANEQARRMVATLGSEHQHERVEAAEWLFAHAGLSRPLLHEAARSGKEPAATGAIRLLGRLGEDQDVHALQELFHSESSRWEAAQALARTGAAEAIRFLIAQTESADGGAIEAAAVALGTAGDQAARPALERLLSHPSEAVRYKAAYALKSLGHRP